MTFLPPLPSVCPWLPWSELLQRNQWMPVSALPEWRHVHWSHQHVQVLLSQRNTRYKHTVDMNQALRCDDKKNEGENLRYGFSFCLQQVSTVRSIWTTATPPLTHWPKNPSALTMASVWTASVATSVCVPLVTWVSAVRVTSTSVCQTHVTPEGPTTVSNWPTATTASAERDTQV